MRPAQDGGGCGRQEGDAQLQGADLRVATIWQVKPPEPDQIEGADLSTISLSPVYPHAARRVLGGLQDKALRKRVEKRFVRLLELGKVAAWAGSADHQTWTDFLSQSKPAPAAVAKILAGLACDDATGGYIVKGIARRVSNRSERRRAYAKLTAKALLDKKTCPAAKHLSEETLAKLRKIAGPGPEKPEPSPEK